MALLQFGTAGATSSAVPASIHCDHLISAFEGAEADLKRGIITNKEVFDFLESAYVCSRRRNRSHLHTGHGSMAFNSSHQDLASFIKLSWKVRSSIVFSSSDFGVGNVQTLPHPVYYS
jgi:hypothetical protein